ncbi:hypothetical protein [Haloarcula pelagica]|uniref:hypothetical protein n=1 Tax=Haloarcula pelagica TaxID=3033389 RepID=UPI0024C400F4|nr:hypothetical protein [Halomicroarcula sp. YJ-61-S]
MKQLRDEQKQRMIDRWDTVFQTLGAEPRRQIVVSLLEAPEDRVLSLPEAANPSYLRVDPSRLATELVHSHLPELAAPGFVRWESEPFTVRRGPAFEEAAIVFRALHDWADEIPPGLAEGCQRLEEKRGDSR